MLSLPLQCRLLDREEIETSAGPHSYSPTVLPTQVWAFGGGNGGGGLAVSKTGGPCSAVFKTGPCSAVFKTGGG